MERDFEQQGRPLPPKLSRLILTAEEENRLILTVSDFTRFYDVTPSYARKMIAELVSKGWLLRVGRGRYQLLPARTGLDPFPMGDKFVVAGQSAPEGFIAYGSAAEYHGLTTQVFQVVVVATPRRRRAATMGAVRIHFVQLAEGNMVGLQPLNRGPNVRVATLERTLLDAIDRPDLCGGVSDLPEILRRGQAKAQVGKLLAYLPSYGSKSLTQRVGFLLTRFGYPLDNQQRWQLHQACAGNTAYLFPQRQAGLWDGHGFDPEWRVVINAPGFGPEVPRA